MTGEDLAGEDLAETTIDATPAPLATRRFGLGQVLTLACANTEAQQMFCSYADLLDVLGYMLGDVPLAERIPAAIERCRPAVHLFYPDLALAQPPAPTAPDTVVLSWLAEQETKHGPDLELTPLDRRAEE